MQIQFDYMAKIFQNSCERIIYIVYRPIPIYFKQNNIYDTI